MPKTGDIVELQSKIAGKKKYHLCICVGHLDGIYKFLMINSKSGFPSEVVFSDGEIPFLPKSPTGNSVVSLSLIVRMNEKAFIAARPNTLGSMPRSVVENIVEATKTMPTLNKVDKALITEKLSSIL